MIKKEDIKRWFDENGFIDWNGDINLVVSQVHDCITELSQDKWVSVEDRLPDDESVVGKVLILIKGNYPMIGSYSDICGKFATYGGVIDDVTHWQLLPELPNDK